MEGDEGLQIGKEEVKVSVFVDDMIIYINDPKSPIGELLQLINTITEVAGYEIN